VWFIVSALATICAPSDQSGHPSAMPEQPEGRPFAIAGFDGLSLRVSGIRFNLTTGELGTPTIHAGLEVWPLWLRQAMTALETVEAERERAVNLTGVARAEAITNGFGASLLAVTAAAATLEAFQASVARSWPILPELQRSWKKNRTPPPARLIETVKAAFIVDHSKTKDMRALFATIFKLRNRAVHPPPEYQSFFRDKELAVDLPRAMADFRVANARESVHTAVGLIDYCLDLPKPKEDFVRWATDGVRLIQPLVNEWETRYPRTPEGSA
jgi:hypothetical protein